MQEAASNDNYPGTRDVWEFAGISALLFLILAAIVIATLHVVMGSFGGIDVAGVTASGVPAAMAWRR